MAEVTELELLLEVVFELELVFAVEAVFELAAATLVILPRLIRTTALSAATSCLMLSFSFFTMVLVFVVLTLVL